MTTDVVLCSAPVMSVVRPSAALGLLQAVLRERGIGVESLYLNLLFAEEIGLDLNEAVADRLPSQLLAGDWLFGRCLPRHAGGRTAARHRAELDAVLRRDGLDALHAVREHAAPAFVDRMADLVLARTPRIVGFSTMFEQTAASLAIAAALKARDPSVTICFGGANCHGPMGAVLLRNFPEIDVVFTGEADTVFGPVVAAILETGRAEGAPGCLVRGAPTVGVPAPVMALDDLPVPDYGDYLRQVRALAEAGRIHPSIPFESSRGCWWGQKHHCTFCGLNAGGMVFRAKSPARVLGEIDRLALASGVRRFGATDNILSLPHIEAVLGTMADAPGTGRRFFYEIKSNATEAQLRTMARAGVVWIQPGIESLSDPVLRLMRKGVGALLNLRLMRNARELGMGLVWSILYGFPGETAEAYASLACLVPLVEHLHPPIGCGRIRLDRFSPNYERAADLGFRNVAPVPAYGAIYDLPEHELADLAYFFEGEAPEAAREADLVALKAAIAVWKARWFEASAIPQLTMLAVGEGRLVSDTRACAIAPFHYATGVEIAVLDALREPGSSEGLLARLSPACDPDDVAAAIEALRVRLFVIELDGVMLSLVTRAGEEVFDAADRSDFPHGFVALPPTREVDHQATRARPAPESRLAELGAAS